jgi:hypothetical protein
MGRFNATCRYIRSRLFPYTARPWGLEQYERKPGADDEAPRPEGG